MCELLGPHVTLLTVSHDFDDLQIIIRKPIEIKKGARIGAGLAILSGITVGGGVVAGNVAKIIKIIERD